MRSFQEWKVVRELEEQPGQGISPDASPVVAGQAPAAPMPGAVDPEAQEAEAAKQELKTILGPAAPALQKVFLKLQRLNPAKQKLVLQAVIEEIMGGGKVKTAGVRGVMRNAVTAAQV